MVRAVAILRYLERRGSRGASLAQIHRVLGLNKSTCHNLLKTLTALGFVEFAPASRRYELGPALFLLGRPLGRNVVDLSRGRAIAPRRRRHRGWGGMIPDRFDYLAPTSVAEALEALRTHGPEAKPLAGGHSLIPLMKLRLASPRYLVDLNRIPGLAGLQEADGVLRIGAMTRHAEMEASDLLRQRYPLLADAARVIADPLVRNMGTVGGSLAHADPAGDWGAAMLAARASVVATGPRGERVVPIDDFFVDTFTTALEPDELLTEIRVPRPGPHSGGAYLKLERKVGDFAVAAVGVQLALDARGTCASVGIGLCNVGPTSLRARGAEEALLGRVPDAAAIARAAQAAAAEADPASDLRGPAEYKRDMVRVLLARALRRALERASGRA
ncbi:MAG: FAD binding domain-containing protein [Armatimonadota bacterium]|nr:FAD binding domain-containing protein [Armatimonadota bacterium]MDR7536354.1 FAD binding domain-containing protein [Armatimonadota bacterium]